MSLHPVIIVELTFTFDEISSFHYDGCYLHKYLLDFRPSKPIKLTNSTHSSTYPNGNGRDGGKNKDGGAETNLGSSAAFVSAPSHDRNAWILSVYFSIKRIVLASVG